MGRFCIPKSFPGHLHLRKDPISGVLRGPDAGRHPGGLLRDRPADESRRRRWGEGGAGPGPAGCFYTARHFLQHEEEAGAGQTLLQPDSNRNPCPAEADRLRGAGGRTAGTRHVQGRHWWARCRQPDVQHDALHLRWWRSSGAPLRGRTSRCLTQTSTCPSVSECSDTSWTLRSTWWHIGSVLEFLLHKGSQWWCININFTKCSCAAIFQIS